MYKRQEKYNIEIVPLNVAFGDDIYTDVAVSYTHLDVYKRQTCNSRFSIG